MMESCRLLFLYFIFISLSETPECDCAPQRQKSSRGADSKALGREGPPGVSCYFAYQNG